MTAIGFLDFNFICVYNYSYERGIGIGLSFHTIETEWDDEKDLLTI
jgi:hypothetical protein